MNELNEIERLRVELERVKAELERIKQKRHDDTCRYATYYVPRSELEAAQKEAADRIAGLESDLLERLDELEKSERQAAAMREALNWLHAGSLCADPATSRASRKDCVICKALTTDAGRDYIHRDQVKPLVEALQMISACSLPFDPDHKHGDRAREALEHARKLDFDPTPAP